MRNKQLTTTSLNSQQHEDINHGTNMLQHIGVIRGGGDGGEGPETLSSMEAWSAALSSCDLHTKHVQI